MKSPGLGVKHGRRRKIFVCLDDLQFDEARAYAEKEGLTFSEAARQLIEFGLEEIKDETL